MALQCSSPRRRSSARSTPRRSTAARRRDQRAVQPGDRHRVGWAAPWRLSDLRCVSGMDGAWRLAQRGREADGAMPLGPALHKILETAGRRAQLPTFSARRYWPLRHPALWVVPVWIEVLVAGTISSGAQSYGASGVSSGAASPARGAADCPASERRPKRMAPTCRRAARGGGYGRAGPGSGPRDDRLVRAVDEMWESWIG